MNSAKLKLLTAILLANTIFSVTGQYAEDELVHKCPACVSKHYPYKRWLMQHTESGQSMGWTDLRGTDCDKGIYKIIPCAGACIEVTVEKQEEVNAYFFEGRMKECSDDLIHSSPDLPKWIDFKYYNEDAVYVAKRLGHRITYNFTVRSSIDRNEFMGKIYTGKEQLTLFEWIMNNKAITAFIFITIALLIFFIVVFACPNVIFRSNSHGKWQTANEDVFRKRLNVSLESIYAAPTDGLNNLEGSVSMDKLSIKREGADKDSTKNYTVEV